MRCHWRAQSLGRPHLGLLKSKSNYFTSCGPHHDIYTFCYWQIFWHSIWHIFWHSIWHILWHSIWYILWHSIWHIFWHIIYSNLLAFYLAHLLAFYLAYLLAFYLTSYLAFSLAYLLAFYLAYLMAFYLAYLLAFYLANLLAFSLAYLLAFYLAYLLTFYLAYLLAFYLAYLMAFYLAYLLAFYLTFYLAYLLAFYLAVEVSGAHWAGQVPGWGPAVHTELGRSQVEVQRCKVSRAGPRLRSSGAHWAGKVPGSGAHWAGKVPGWGPAVRTELGSWRRAWRRVGKAEVEVEVDADMVKEKLEEEAEEEQEEQEDELAEEEEEENNSDKILQPSPGRWGKIMQTLLFGSNYQVSCLFWFFFSFIFFFSDGRVAPRHMVLGSKLCWSTWMPYMQTCKYHAWTTASPCKSVEGEDGFEGENGGPQNTHPNAKSWPVVIQAQRKQTARPQQSVGANPPPVPSCRRWRSHWLRHCRCMPQLPGKQNAMIWVSLKVRLCKNLFPVTSSGLQYSAAAGAVRARQEGM